MFLNICLEKRPKKDNYVWHLCDSFMETDFCSLVFISVLACWCSMSSGYTVSVDMALGLMRGFVKPSQSFYLVFLFQ